MSDKQIIKYSIAFAVACWMLLFSAATSAQDGDEEAPADSTQAEAEPEPEPEPEPREDDLSDENQRIVADSPPPSALEDNPPIEYYVPPVPPSSTAKPDPGDDDEIDEDEFTGFTQNIDEERLPYSQWDMELQVILGMSFLGYSGTTIDVGASFDVFVIDGLAPGVQTWYEYNSDWPDALFLLPFLKWVFYRSWDFAPYLIAQGGRAFVFENGVDAWLAGGGIGLVWLFTRNFGLSMELKVLEVIYDEDVCFETDSFGYCTNSGKLDTWILPSIGFAILF